MYCGLCEAVKDDLYRIINRNEDSIALIIREPQIKYHSLVLPIRHITTFSDLSPEESHSLHTLVQTLTTRMDKVLGSSAIATINGESHRTQPHIHYQVIPVHDGIRTIISGHLGIPERYPVSELELERMAKKLR